MVLISSPLRSYLLGVLFGGLIFGTSYLMTILVVRHANDYTDKETTWNFRREVLADIIGGGKNKASKLTDLKAIPTPANTSFTRIKCPTGNGTWGRNVAAKLECKKRLPQAIGIGFEKCGTGALSFFLNSHPALAHSLPQEIYYWNKNNEKDLEWYREQMPISSKVQVTMEKTPSYVFESDIPGRIKALMPNTKFIAIIRDPIVRAMSDYLHLLTVGWPEFFVPRPVGPGGEPLCFLNTTFEGSVIKPNGDVNSQNSIVVHSAYVLYLKRWMSVFPRSQFLVIDGDEFARNPLPVLQEVETFLGMPKYFNNQSVYFDEKKGFFCKSQPKVCTGDSKGRPHPPIADDVIKKLRAYYEPYNAELEQLIGRNFSWT